MADFFGSVFKSIVDFKFYKIISGNKVSKSFKYLAKLLLIVTIFLSIRFFADFVKFADDAMNWFDSNIGKIEIKNGAVLFDKPQPFTIKRFEFTLSIDTTGKISSVEGAWGMLFTKDKLLYKDQLGNISQYDLSKIPQLVLNRNFFEAIKKNILWLIYLLIFLGTYVILFFAKLVQLGAFSIFSVVINLFRGAGLMYKSLINIGIYALTPSIILGLLVDGLKINIPNFWILYSGIYMIFIIMGIVNTKESV